MSGDAAKVRKLARYNNFWLVLANFVLLTLQCAAYVPTTTMAQKLYTILRVKRAIHPIYKKCFFAEKPRIILHLAHLFL